ncbi:hypothetical protein ACVXG8_17605 [Escherichia coli]
MNGTTDNTAQRGVQLCHFQRVASQFLINRNDFIQFVLVVLDLPPVSPAYSPAAHFYRFAVESW